MRKADLVVATGSQNNVRSAYASGTPAFGVGAGNVASIIDSSADLEQAATHIARSKTFDNATSCSSENSVVILDDVFDAALAALRQAGGVLLEPAGKAAAPRDPLARRQAQPAHHRAGRAEGRRARRPRARGVRRGPVPPGERDRDRSGSSVLRREAVPRSHGVSRAAISTTPPGSSRKSTLTRAPAIRSASTLRTTPASRGSRWSCRSAASSSTRRIASPPAETSTTACRSRCRWAAARGGATTSPTT